MPEPVNEKMGINSEDYEIGYHNNGQVMVVTVPLRKWAGDKDYGDIKVSGVFVKAERIALKNLQMMRAEAAGAAQQKGVITAPAGVIPMPGMRPN